MPAGTPPSTQAQDAVVTPGAAYTGLAIGSVGGKPMLYAADFTAGTVDVYNGQFQRVITSGNFKDPQLPSNYAPFNVAVLNDVAYVAYAKENKQGNHEVPGPGFGRIDAFTLNGKLLTRMPSTGLLNAPWGLAIAPAGFGTFSGDLLVGNFGDGRIHAYDPTSLAALGTLKKPNGKAIAIDGLWALLPGNGVQSGKDEVIFSAGPDDETHGLLGTLAIASSQ